MTVVDVFVLQGCVRCLAGLDELRDIASSYGADVVRWNERDLVANIDHAVQLGILSAPAIVINGQLAFSALPTPEQLRTALAGPTSGA